jgi:hypothetical protein
MNVTPVVVDHIAHDELIHQATAGLAHQAQTTLAEPWMQACPGSALRAGQRLGGPHGPWAANCVGPPGVVTGREV